MFFSFPGQIGNEWSHEGGKRFEATCKFAVLTLQSPDTEDFVIQFGSQVSQFEVSLQGTRYGRTSIKLTEP